MPTPTKIQHPLLDRPGMSQRKRGAHIDALSPTFARLDDRSMVDMLVYIQNYARNVVFHELKIDENQQQYVELGNWLNFFEASLPFQLARFSKLDLPNLERELHRISSQVMHEKSVDALTVLFDFTFNELFYPIAALWSPVRNIPGQDARFELLFELENVIRTQVLIALERYLTLRNTAAKYHCVPKLPFQQFLAPPWALSPELVFLTDEHVVDIAGGNPERVTWYRDEIANLLLGQMSALRRLVELVPKHVKASFEVLEEQHEPHLGLLFAFIRLYTHFQGDLNNLSAAHLDFFYEQVLQIKPKGVRPDTVHLIFEVANHIKDGHLIKKDTVFRDGKDDNGVDIDFVLDEEIVIDTAKVESLKTLYLNHVNYLDKNGSDVKKKTAIEGVYKAPVAKSVDGQGIEFTEEQSPNWALLGGRESKHAVENVEEGNKQIVLHPFGRSGFVLSAPVLWLNEGERQIWITLNCAFDEDEAVKNALDQLIESEYLCDEEKLELNDAFDIQLSGSDDWFTPSNAFEKEIKAFTICKDGDGYIVKFRILLKDDEPAVTFFDDEKILEPFVLKNPFPLVKIELNQALRVPVGPQDEKAKDCCDENAPEDCCCLDRPITAGAEASLYHFFRGLAVTNIEIDVEVCGVKNLVVQNEENLQNVSDLMLPFGVRPKLGAEFYVGSKEVFCKKWDRFDLKIEWKDRPANFEEHYVDYFADDTPAEDKITNDSFTVNTAVLEHGLWVTRTDDAGSPKKLFVDDPSIPDTFCDVLPGSGGFKNRYAFNRSDFSGLSVDLKVFDDEQQSPLSVNSRFAFLRFKLGGTDFLHEEYPFVLARNLIKLAGLIDPNDIPDLKKELKNAIKQVKELEPDSGTIDPSLVSIKNKIAGSSDDILDQLTTLTQQVDDGVLKVIRDQVLPRIGSTGSALANIRAAIDHDEPPGGPVDIDNDGVLQLTQGILDELSDARSHIALNEIADALGHIGTAEDFADKIKEKLGDDTTPNTVLKLLLDSIAANTDDSSELGAIVTLITADPNGILKRIENIRGRLNGIITDIDALIVKVQAAVVSLGKVKEFVDVDDDELDSLGVPKEPYTPLIKSISIDYTAQSKKSEIALIHLLPFEKSALLQPLSSTGTELPMLLHTIDDEGSLFIGIDALRPGANLQMLFQLAEATADSESNRADVKWHYLAANEWHELRDEFEILYDRTNGLTRSGIIKFALPRKISNAGNTIMPAVGDPGKEKHLFWLRASAVANTAGVAEAIDIHAQAATATFRVIPGSDENRVDAGLEPNLLSKPLEPDFSIKKVNQPYASFGGKVPEVAEHLYSRVSEHLRHKGRSIDAFDYEHLVLEAFPGIFKCKCISHTLGLSANDFRRDLEVAPGFIVVAVIPDLTRLQAGDGLEPKVPVSILLEIKDFLRKRMSAFTRVKVMNPRYEKIKVDTKVRLRPGKDVTFFKSQLKEDVTRFLAPWYLGDSDKLSFGQRVAYSEVIEFIENLDYIDFIDTLKLYDEKNSGPDGKDAQIIVPATARSILTGGDIKVQIDEPDCNPSQPGPRRELPGGIVCNEPQPFDGIEEPIERGELT